MMMRLRRNRRTLISSQIPNQLSGSVPSTKHNPGSGRNNGLVAPTAQKAITAHINLIVSELPSMTSGVSSFFDMTFLSLVWISIDVPLPRFQVMASERDCGSNGSTDEADPSHN